jgi:cell division control protein 6
MAGYLDRIGAGLVLKDIEPLSFDYIPSKLVGRDDKLVDLASIFSTIISPEASCNALITGPVGSGKTALAKVFAKDVKDTFSKKRKISYLHVNCRNYSTTPQVLHRIITTLEPRYPVRGLSASEVLSSIRKILTSMNQHLLIILDEVNHILIKEGNDLLYNLLRIDEDKQGKGTLSLILISQEEILNILEGAVISRLGIGNHLRLSGYNREGLFEIAKQRAELSLFKESYTDEILDLIADSASSRGDARNVLHLIEGAAKNAEKDGRKNIIPQDIQKISSKDVTAVEPHTIDTLRPHAQLLLLAICRRLKKETEITSGDAEQLYHVVCEEYNQTPKGHTTLWKYIKDLELKELLSSKYGAVPQGRGRTQHLTMPNILPSDLITRLESSLNRQYGI